MSNISQSSNPFVRGYLNLRVVQTQAPVYAIYGDDVDGRSVHIGDADSEQAAQAVAQRLRFNTGIYSRCWEISSAHLRLPRPSVFCLSPFAFRIVRPSVSS